MVTSKYLPIVPNPLSLHLPSPVRVASLDYEGNVLACHDQQQGGKRVKNA